MGAVTFSVDSRLIDTLTKHLSCQIFIETGTFRGDTVEIVKENFDQIYSIELSEKYYNDCLDRFKHIPKIKLIHGDSATALSSVTEKIQSAPAIFWLDAHWCVADKTEGQLSQCPLLKELEAIQKLSPESVVIIDDARLFLAAPKTPHEISHWPTFDSIIKSLYRLSDKHQITIVNDCIVFYPAAIHDVIQQFAHEHGVDWLQAMDKSRDYDKLLTQLIEKEAMIQKLALELRKK